MLRLAFQKNRERYLEDPNQLKLDFGEGVCDAAAGLADAVEESQSITVPEHPRRKKCLRKTRDEQLPAHLERRDVTVEAPESVRFCSTHGERKIIGYDYQETLMFEQPQLWVKRLAIPKFACPDDSSCGIVEPPRPVGLVEGNRYDTSVAAQIITMKSGYHMPIYREQDLFAGSGWSPQRSTLLNIAAAAGDLLPAFIASLRSRCAERTDRDRRHAGHAAVASLPSRGRGERSEVEAHSRRVPGGPRQQASECVSPDVGLSRRGTQIERVRLHGESAP